MLYLITKSASYYPEAGTRDWVSMETDEAEARAFFERTVAASGPLTGDEDLSDFTVCLIRINPETGEYRILEER